MLGTTARAWSLGGCGGGKVVAMSADTAVIERPTGFAADLPSNYCRE